MAKKPMSWLPYLKRQGKKPCGAARTHPMERNTQVIMLVMVTLVCIALAPSSVVAETREFQWSARITVSEQYDDNINLEPHDKESDWITTAGPGLTLAFLLEETEVRLSYDIFFSFYAENRDQNDVSHHLTLSGLKGIPIADNVTLDLDESFTVSEDPVEISEQTTSGSRRSRKRYYRNTAGGRLNYLFGEEDFLYAGFRHRLLFNDDSNYEDSQEFRPGAGLAYWFTVRHGVSLDYEYAKAEFDVSDDYEKHYGRFTYRYRFSPEVQTNIFYSYESTDFDGTQRQDYEVHNGGAGLDLEVTENSSLSLWGGYYYRDREQGDNNEGFSGSFLFSRIFARGSLNLQGSAGYREQYIAAENLGFSEYYAASASLTYELLEELTGNISGFFWRDEYKDVEPKRDEDTWGGRVGLNYPLLSWLSSSLSYQYRRVESTLDENEYTDNRVTLTLVAFYLSKPKPF